MLLNDIGHKVWWLCLGPTTTTKFTSDLGYRMTKNSIGLYNENAVYEQWHQIASVIFLNPNMCGFLYIRMLASSQTLVVNWQN